MNGYSLTGFFLWSQKKKTDNAHAIFFFFFGGGGVVGAVGANKVYCGTSANCEFRLI